ATECHVSDVSRLDDASLSYSSFTDWDEYDKLDAFLALSRRVWQSLEDGDFWSYMLLAEGAVDLAAEPELELYDMAALDVIVRGAAGRFARRDVTPGPNGGSALASNGRLHDQALAFLGSLPDDADDPDVAPRRHGSLHDLSSRRGPGAPEQDDDCPAPSR